LVAWDLRVEGTVRLEESSGVVPVDILDQAHVVVRGHWGSPEDHYEFLEVRKDEVSQAA
jgi:hypothetical protein